MGMGSRLHSGRAILKNSPLFRFPLSFSLVIEWQRGAQWVLKWRPLGKGNPPKTAFFKKFILPAPWAQLDGVEKYRGQDSNLHR